MAEPDVKEMAATIKRHEEQIGRLFRIVRELREELTTKRKRGKGSVLHRISDPR